MKIRNLLNLNKRTQIKTGNNSPPLRERGRGEGGWATGVLQYALGATPKLVWGCLPGRSKPQSLSRS